MTDAHGSRTKGFRENGRQSYSSLSGHFCREGGETTTKLGGAEQAAFQKSFLRELNSKETKDNGVCSHAQVWGHTYEVPGKVFP